MRSRILIIVTLLLILVCYTSYAQLADSVDVSTQTPDPSGIPMISYSSQPKPYIINDITVYGVNFQDPRIIVSASGLAVGETIYIPGNAISQAVSRLWSQRYYSDVKVIADILDDDKVNLEIYLQERPRVYNWRFEGIRKGEASNLLEDLKLKRGTELSDYVINKNIHLIKKFYSEKGFRNAEVTPRIENDSLFQNAVNVIFVIDKKNKVRIEEIVFEGNEEFTDKRLRRTMKKTHQKKGTIFRNAKMKDDEYEDDKDNIIDFYNSKGFRNAVIVKDSIYTINEKRIGINITLEEGGQFYIRDVKWVGNTKYSTEYLQAIFGVKKGDIYDKKTIHKRLGIGKEENPDDMSQIKSLYQNEGYLFSMIDPSEIIIGEDSIDLEIKIFEGKPFTINNVDISGNINLDDEVIRREIQTRPGELYNRALIMHTIRQLAQTNHFDPASIMPNIQPVSNELVDISWPLIESPNDRFDISGGWGGGMFVGSVGVQLNNISLRNFFKKGAWRPYPHGQNQQLVIRASTNGSYYKSFMGSFTEPWLGGKKPHSLTVSAFYSEETNASYFGGVFTRASSYFRTTGVAVGSGQRLLWPDHYFTLYNEIGYQVYNLKNWGQNFLFTDGRSHTITLKTVLARNTTNQYFYPSAGSDFSLSLTLTPPYSLFDGKNYAEMGDRDPEKHKWIEYHKWHGRFAWYYPLSSNNKLVFMAAAEMGYLGYYNKHKQSPFEQFDVGGDGMSGYSVYGIEMIKMRGYKDGSLTPVTKAGQYANVYNKYTAELRYLLIAQGSTQIYGLVFAEAGNAFTSWNTFDPFSVKRSLGVGMKLFLPVVGILGLDWGYGFDKAVGGTKRSGGNFHFSIGMEF